MGPKRKKHTNKTIEETAAISTDSISMENVAISQAILAAAGTETAPFTSNRERFSGKNKNKNRGHQPANHHHHHTSLTTTNGSHHYYQNPRKRSLRQRQQSSSFVKNGNNNISNNIQEHDDIEEQLKRQRQKQAEKEAKSKQNDIDDNDADDAADSIIGGATASALPPKNLGMYQYDPKRQAYFPATSCYSFSMDDAEDDDDIRNSHPCDETSSQIVARYRTFPHTPLARTKLADISSSSSSSLSSSSCSFAYPVACCSNLSQRLGLVSTWAGREILESFGWTPSAAFLPLASNRLRGSQAAHTWQYLHGCATMSSINNNSIIVRPVDIDCKIGTVSWTRTFDVQWPTDSNHDNNNGSDNSFRRQQQQPPRVVTVTDLDYLVQQHGRPQGRHLNFSRHCLGASVHSPRFLDTIHNPAGNANNSTPSSLLGTLDSAHGRSSLRIHKLFNDEDENNNHADVVFNLPSTQNDFVYGANDSIVFAPVLHHSNQQSHHRHHRQGIGNGNVNNNNNRYVPWLLCIEHGSFGAIRNEVNDDSERLFPNSEALCVEADPSSPHCFYFGHRNGQVTLFDINTGCGQSTQQSMAATTTNRGSVPFFGSITSIHPLSSSLSPRQVLARGSQGSCRLYDFRKLGSSRRSSSSGGTKQGKRHAHSHGDPSLVYEMTPLPLLEDNNLGNKSEDADGGGNNQVQRRHRRRQVQRLTSRCNGVVANPEETVVISPHVQVQGADHEEMPTLGFWSLHTGDWIGSKPLAPSSSLTGNDNEHHEQFPATGNWGVSWIELSQRITPAWQWRNPKLDDNEGNHNHEGNNEQDRENDASNLRPRPGSFGLFYKSERSMAGPGLPPSAGSIHHVYATGNPDR